MLALDNAYSRAEIIMKMPFCAHLVGKLFSSGAISTYGILQYCMIHDKNLVQKPGALEPQTGGRGVL